ncbi:MAG: hypothetical protein ACXWWQ_05200 [Candidatus Limnocylindria bacterium]
MDGATITSVSRSVQLAVMSTPTTTVAEAVAEARRRQAVSGRDHGPMSVRVAALSAAA